jgi:hypothetical protein
MPGRKNLMWISDTPGLVGVYDPGKRHEVAISNFLAGPQAQEMEWIGRRPTLRGRGERRSRFHG